VNAEAQAHISLSCRRAFAEGPTFAVASARLHRSLSVRAGLGYDSESGKTSVKILKNGNYNIGDMKRKDEHPILNA
jgi:hypothetical protein